MMKMVKGINEQFWKLEEDEHSRSRSTFEHGQCSLICHYGQFKCSAMDKGLFTYYVSRRRGGRGYGKC